MSDNNRQRVSMPILGLDTSSTDLQARDGAMQELHNMRYSGEAWRNVKPFKEEEFIQYDMGDDVIVYQHPADQPNVYLAIRPDQSGMTGSLLRVRISNGQYVDLETLDDYISVHETTFTHLGSVLISAGPQGMGYFILEGNGYQRFTYPKAPETYRLPYCFVDDNPFDNGERDGYSFVKRLSPYGAASSSSYILVDANEKSFVQAAVDGDYWWGEICYFVAYEMEDGTLISTSPLDILASELDECSDNARYINWFGTSSEGTKWPSTLRISRNYLVRWYGTVDDPDRDLIALIHSDTPTANDPNDPQEVSYYPLGTNTFKILPKVRIKIDETIDSTGLIKRVSIYATRINPIWDIDKLLAKESFVNGSQWEFNEFYADNKLAEQPFYLVESIPISDFSNGELIYSMTGAKLKENINKTAYEPIETHRHEYSTAKEYNSRMHINSQLHLFEGFGNSLFNAEPQGSEVYHLGVTIPINTRDYKTLTSANGELGLTSSNLKKILSYPDYRASHISILEDASEGYIEQGRYTLLPARALNYAYKTSSDVGEEMDSEDYSGADAVYYLQYVKYSIRHTVERVGQLSYLQSSVIQKSNIVKASAPNNPLVFPLANSYAIGTDDNKIIAINAAALEMSDAKFGEFPLYIFTKEGIFAMQSGSGEVLYGAIIPVNHDRIINPNTLAVNYNIIYITSRGVHALFSNEATLISGAINDAANQPPLDFLTTAKMAYQHKFSEIVLYNTDYDNGSIKYPNAYMFSLDTKMWSTRSWHVDDLTFELLNSGVLIMQGDGRGSVGIADFQEEVNGAVDCRIISRPIKFDSQEFKRIETLVARLQADPPTGVHIELQASNDLVNWMPCREVTSVAQRDLNIRRTPYSARYFRIALECTSNGDLAIMGFDFEYYMRFLHRMR